MSANDSDAGNRILSLCNQRMMRVSIALKLTLTTEMELIYENSDRQR
ncbi:MAG: hypothetical protein ACIAQZ_02295 [Sedimentisphaeraceae bacterium JB056]